MNTTSNKAIIKKVNEGFAKGDVEQILNLVADDVRWHIAGLSTANGKLEFRKEIVNENFEGLPVIHITHEIEEGDHVAVEGTVQCKIRGGGIFDALFHNVYRLEEGKIREMRSYVVENKTYQQFKQKY